MLPPTFKGRALLSVKVDNVTVPVSTQLVNGVEYAFVTVPAGNHSFTADYKSDLPGAAPSRNYYTALPLTLTWNRVSSAVQYQVQVSSNNFASLAYTTIVPATSLSTTITALADNTYYWRVRAQRNGVWSGWSAVDQFTLKTQ